MPRIVTQISDQSMQVNLVDKIEDLPESIQSNLGINKFKAAYKQVAILIDIKTIFVGTKLSPVAKSSDPYFTQNYFELGAELGNALSAITIQDLNLNKFTGNGKNLHDFLLGLYQSVWKFDKYLKATESKLYDNLKVGLSKDLNSLLTDELAHSLTVLNEAMSLTRTVVNDTPEAINPQSMPEIINQELGELDHISIKRIDVQEMESLGMEGILAVGRASRFAPVLMHTVLKPRGEVKRRIALVGKGLTYDSGGYSIKPDGGLTMKMDMAGSATMFGVMKALSMFELDGTEVHWISSFAENLIDGRAYKPDDILTSYSGQTIEILNTDAEGRLTLADGLTYATLQKPDYIIDAATLTGAAVMAVSEYYTALMGNDEDLIHSVLSSFEEEQEMTVHTRMPEVLREAVKGKISDLINTATISRQAGHLTAGLFLSHFVDQNLFRNPKLNIDKPVAFPWVHLDIAGSAYNTKHNSLLAEGATGQSVRSLVNWIMKLDRA